MFPKRLRHEAPRIQIRGHVAKTKFGSKARGQAGGLVLVNKSELVDAMAEAADIPKSAAARALDALTDSVAATLKNGDSVSIIGFGTFTVKERAARTGRNPQTGAAIQIAASKNPSFKAGKALKDAIQ